jgi:hypothetical protein
MFIFNKFSNGSIFCKMIKKYKKFPDIVLARLLNFMQGLGWALCERDFRPAGRRPTRCEWARQGGVARPTKSYWAHLLHAQVEASSSFF